MNYYDRKTGQILQEHGYGDGKLTFLYTTVFGRLLLKLVSAPVASDLAALYYRSPLSRGKIRRFAAEFLPELTQQQLSDYRSFNDFFIRTRPTAFDPDPQVLTAVADSKLSVFPISEALRLDIKNSTYSVEELLQDRDMARRFAGGTCLVFRLVMSDIHHYHFFDRGEVLQSKKIKGQLHTVRPISEAYRVYARNQRHVTLMATEHFGTVAQIEVGALLVGRIVNHPIKAFERGTVKGHFEFGGSTVVVLLEKNPQLDADIIAANASGLETRVLAGERIGKR